jgi:hypothetical protein
MEGQLGSLGPILDQPVKIRKTILFTTFQLHKNECKALGRSLTFSFFMYLAAFLPTAGPGLSIDFKMLPKPPRTDPRHTQWVASQWCFLWCWQLFLKHPFHKTPLHHPKPQKRNIFDRFGRAPESYKWTALGQLRAPPGVLFRTFGLPQ